MDVVDFCYCSQEMRMELVVWEYYGERGVACKGSVIKNSKL